MDWFEDIVVPVGRILRGLLILLGIAAAIAAGTLGILAAAVIVLFVIGLYGILTGEGQPYASRQSYRSTPINSDASSRRIESTARTSVPTRVLPEITVPPPGAGRVFQVGAGSLGSFTAQAFVDMGVESIGILDPQTVEMSNTGKSMYNEYDVGSWKVAAAMKHMLVANPGVQVDAHHGSTREVTTEEDLIDLVGGAGLLVLTFDDVSELFRIADAWYWMGPVLFGAVQRRGSGGHAVITLPGVTRCLRCSLGVQDPSELNVLHGEQARAEDVRKVAIEVARLGMELMDGVDPRRGESNLVLFSSDSGGGRSTGADLEWVSFPSQWGCMVCSR